MERIIVHVMLMQCEYKTRTFLSIVGGVIAGILGLTGVAGFVFYFLVMTIASVGLVAKAKFNVNSYFDSWNRVVFDGITAGLMMMPVEFSLTIHRFAYDLKSSGRKKHKR
ncbi:hypothetical protein V2J09_014333 [Rumex salicifolius]